MTQVKAIAVSMATLSSLTKQSEGKLKFADFWAHSLAIANTMRILTRHMPPRMRPMEDKIFLAGLLHDIGYYVLSYIDISISNALHEKLNADTSMPLLDIENRIAGATPETLRVLAWLFGPLELLPNFLSGLICLALFEGAYVTEIVRAGIEAVPKGQWEAARALGLHAGQVMGEVVLPQAVQKMVPALAGQFIALIKDSSLISLISIQELTFTGTELAVSSGRVFEVWLTVAALYFLLCFGLARLFGWLERRLGRYRRR